MENSLSNQRLQTNNQDLKLVYTSTRKSEKLKDQISVQSFRYEYGYRYGSSDKDKKDHKVMKLIGEGPYEIVVDQL